MEQEEYQRRVELLKRIPIDAFRYLDEATWKIHPAELVDKSEERGLLYIAERVTPDMKIRKAPVVYEGDKINLKGTSGRVHKKDWHDGGIIIQEGGRYAAKLGFNAFNELAGADAYFTSSCTCRAIYPSNSGFLYPSPVLAKYAPIYAILHDDMGMECFEDLSNIPIEERVEIARKELVKRNSSISEELANRIHLIPVTHASGFVEEQFYE